MSGPQNLARVDSEIYSRWAARYDELRDVAGSVIESQAFQRLSRITFLGILSPRFTHLSGYPFKADASTADGSRASHSAGVALLAMDCCLRLGLDTRRTRLAIAWGLLHDIGNWPLSHTG